MSRCFPYPPPGYCRNGATYESLIESIKLQKETDKAKAERKKQKREKKEKKEKERRKDAEKGKLQKNPNEFQQDPCKVSQISVGSKEALDKRTGSGVEVLEKSDLTEEHGQPISSHKPSYSSDSTQNSNKRKRDAAFVPDGTSGHGKPIKIRLLKKTQGPDSSKETLCSGSGRTDPQSLGGAGARSGTWKLSTNTDPLVPSVSNSVNGLEGNGRAGAPATSGRENTKVQDNLSQANSTSRFEKAGTKHSDLQRLHFKQSPAPSSGRLILPPSQSKHEIPSRNSNKTGLVSSQLRTKNVEALHLSRQIPIPSYEKPVVPQTHSIPSPASNLPPRKDGVQGLSLDLDKKASGSGKRGISETRVGAKEAKAKPTRFEKKMRKKQAKYEKLMGSWIPPPVVEALRLPGDDDQDWLLRSKKRVNGSSCVDDVETCREAAATVASLWQPCSRYLAEADIHALPYTVPF